MSALPPAQSTKNEDLYETFNSIEQRVSLLITECARRYGFKNCFVRNVLTYCKCLVRPGTKDTIDEIIFTYQMMKHFGIVDRLMLGRMYTVLREPTVATMSVADYVRCICTLLCKDVDILAEYTFKIYDLSSRGAITSVELTQLLQSCVKPSDSDDTDRDEMVSEVVDLVMAATDIDRSGSISFQEYSAKIKSDILLLQLLGKCLPSDKARAAFSARLTDRSFTAVISHFRAERSICLREDIPQLSGYYPFHLAL